MAEGDATVQNIVDSVQQPELNTTDALKTVLKKAQTVRGVSRGLRETVKALDRRDAHFCVLAEDCDKDEYRTLVEALCSHHNIPLFTIESKEELAQAVGIVKYTKDLEVKKVGKCSSCAVRDFGPSTRELNFILEKINEMKK
eukprot:gb/GECH01011161.1/.p1 GENE.gb/GECH01011161.1/~~gb/GECH01011161.1/.p1  ORF type:complete len:142 (+),score=31.77 gb/GECH01011161.1/:1-426(+)